MSHWNHNFSLGMLTATGYCIERKLITHYSFVKCDRIIIEYTDHVSIPCIYTKSIDDSKWGTNVKIMEIKAKGHFVYFDIKIEIFQKICITKLHHINRSLYVKQMVWPTFKNIHTTTIALTAYKYIKFSMFYSIAIIKIESKLYQFLIISSSIRDQFNQLCSILICCTIRNMN